MTAVTAARILTVYAPTITPDPPAWTESAVCQSVDPELFFPQKGGSVRAAKRVCAVCPVRADCLADALAHGERFGVWGGLSDRERLRLRLHGKPPTPAFQIRHGTESGYYAHRRRHEPPCEGCRVAASKANGERKNRRRGETLNVIAAAEACGVDVAPVRDTVPA
jgi:WhiB family redox-sensing transcriptional regulator